MIFLADTAVATELLALAAGSALLIWACQSQGSHRLFGKIAGIFVIAVSLITLLCTSYYSLRYWEDGLFRFHPGPPPWAVEDEEEGEKGGKMMKCPMMEKMKKMREEGGKEPGLPASPSPGGGHEAHH